MNEYSRRTNRVYGQAPILVAGAILFAFGLAGCGSPSDGKFRLGMMPKLMGIPYFKACHAGAEEAAAELGIHLNYDGPATDSVELQNQMIDQWAATGVDAIAVAPNDPEVISAALRRAKENNIVTLTWDADANPERSGRSVFVNQAPTVAIGETMVDVLAEGIGGKGKAVIVTGSANSPNQNAWMKVMNKRLVDKYPGIELLQTLAPEEDQNRARKDVLQLFAAHPDLRGIWGITSVSLPGAAQAVRELGKSGQVYVSGLGLPSEVAPYVEDGTVPKFILWDPKDLGYLTVHVAFHLHKHKKLADGKHDFGRLKGIKVEGGEVILGPPLVFDKENVRKYAF